MTVSKRFVVGLLALALLGFADAAYLTAKHFQGVIPPCTTDGCEKVLTSSYATVGPIPLALGGVVYYALLVMAFVLAIDSGAQKALRVAAGLMTGGFVASLGLVVIQLFVLHAVCLYCMGSALVSLVLFGGAVKIFRAT